MSAPDKIKELTKHFQDGITDFKSGNYNEARLRIEFLNPFFKALGWDVDNE
ncbi:MAG: type IV restriction endonuclease, partial [Leptospiraceae bacterium]|nr:type IV restriction endonuclease [Leptospiraceae bacterium]